MHGELLKARCRACEAVSWDHRHTALRRIGGSSRRGMAVSVSCFVEISTQRATAIRSTPTIPGVFKATRSLSSSGDPLLTSGINGFLI